jgi:hypothetical protein
MFLPALKVTLNGLARAEYGGFFSNLGRKSNRRNGGEGEHAADQAHTSTTAGAKTRPGPKLIQLQP